MPRSRLRRRVAGPTVRKVAAHAEVDALLAVIDMLERESTAPDAFTALVDIMRNVVPFDAIAISENGPAQTPLVYYAPGLEAVRSTALSVVESARRYFLGEASFDAYVSLISKLPEHWISLPLSNDGEEILGLMTVASTAVLGEGTIAFLACVARHFARTVGDWRRHVEASKRVSARARSARCSARSATPARSPKRARR